MESKEVRIFCSEFNFGELWVAVSSLLCTEVCLMKWYCGWLVSPVTVDYRASTSLVWPGRWQKQNQETWCETGTKQKKLFTVKLNRPWRSKHPYPRGFTPSLHASVTCSNVKHFTLRPPAVLTPRDYQAAEVTGRVPLSESSAVLQDGGREVSASSSPKDELTQTRDYVWARLPWRGIRKKNRNKRMNNALWSFSNFCH